MSGLEKAKRDDAAVSDGTRRMTAHGPELTETGHSGSYSPDFNEYGQMTAHVSDLTETGHGRQLTAEYD